MADMQGLNYGHVLNAEKREQRERQKERERERERGIREKKKGD